jgi:NADPH:quinone reductase-like Zn-dependent oxidoreductase
MDLIMRMGCRMRALAPPCCLPHRRGVNTRRPAGAARAGQRRPRAWGAFAEYAVAPAARLARMPRNLGFTPAASLPLVGVSAMQAVVEHMKLQRGQKVLVHGGGGGIGNQRTFKVLRRGGILVSTTHPPKNDLPEQYGVTLIDESTRMDTQALESLARLVEAGVVTAHVDRAYPLDQIRRAFEDKEGGGGRVRGKIAIVVRP